MNEESRPMDSSGSCGKIGLLNAPDMFFFIRKPHHKLQMASGGRCKKPENKKKKKKKKHRKGYWHWKLSFFPWRRQKLGQVVSFPLLQLLASAPKPTLWPGRFPPAQLRCVPKPPVNFHGTVKGHGEMCESRSGPLASHCLVGSPLSVCSLKHECLARDLPYNPQKDIPSHKTQTHPLRQISLFEPHTKSPAA